MSKMTGLIGYLAAICTTLAFVPQALKTIKSRDTTGISLSMYVIFTTGVFFWLVYGLLLVNFPLIAANLVTFVLSATILWFKLKYK